MAEALDGQGMKSYTFMKSEGANFHSPLKKAILEWVWVDLLSVEENVLPGKALTPSVLLPLPCLAFVTQDCMPPDITDRVKMHPNALQK